MSEESSDSDDEDTIDIDKSKMFYMGSLILAFVGGVGLWELAIWIDKFPKDKILWGSNIHAWGAIVGLILMFTYFALAKLGKGKKGKDGVQ